MSKKGLKTMLVCIVLLIGLVTLFACNKSDVADKDGQTKVIVKIQDEDGSIYKENVVFSDLFTLSLQKEGYTGRLYRDADFLKPLTKDSKVKNGDTVYVKWTINKYTVTFMDGEKVLETFTNVTHGSAVTAPEVPKKDGKTFSKWDKDFKNITSDLTINAVYDVNTFTVTFKDGEKVLETQTVEYEAAATAPDIARLSPPEGKHFAKWDKDFSKVTEDIEVSAVYELNEYTVTFKNGETTLKTEMVKHGFAATAPNVFDTPTEKFVGWDKSFDNVTSDLIVNAKLEKQKYTLTFINFDGTTVYTAAVEYGASIRGHFETADNDVAYDATILDYVGWYDNSDTEKTIIDDFSELTMPTRDLTYVLKLRLMDSAIGDFKVNTPADFTYDENNSAVFTVNGTPYAGVTYKYIWTINKDNVIYKTEETTESSLTLQNLAAGEYFAKVRIVASMENCGTVEKDFTADETLIVSRADISGIKVTVTSDKPELTYGDKTAKIAISGLSEGDVVTYGTDGTTFPLQNVDLSALDYGEYDYFVRVDRGDNYNPYTSGKITVTINKATVSATVTPKSDKLTYGDNLPSLTAAINGETYTIESGKYELHLGMTSITGNVANNVGTYNIENVDISVLRAKYPEKNYDITLTTVGTITINMANLTVTVTLDKTELTYGEVLPKITYKFDGLKLSDTEENFTRTETEFAKKLDVGTYTATVTLSGEKTKFYKITVNDAEFKVNKKAATITINKVDDIEYGDKVPDLSAKVEVKGVLDGDSLSYTLNPNYEVGNKPGDYTASVVFDENAEANKNYSIIATGTTFNVGTKDLTIKLNNTATVAVGKTYKVEAEHLEKIGLVAGDTVTGHVTITKDVKGTYNADDFDKSNLVVKNADCYVISYEMSVEFVEVTFAIDFADVTLTYDGQPHGVKVTAKEGTNYTITYGTTENDCTLTSSPEYTNADTYKIYFKVVDNDTLAEEKGSVTLTINKKAVTVKVNDVTITYGETPKFECTVTGLVEGETLSGEAVYSGAGKDVGEYVISVSGITASDNYNVSFVTGKLTINKKTAEVAWTIAENYVYSPDGQTLPMATYDGKTANLIFTKDGKECKFKNAGTYTVTVADDNYILTNNEKTIVINKARYTAAPALSLSGTYDPNKTLGNYALAEGFTWADAGEIPVCTKTEYAAKYNMDPVNYEDFATTVTLTLKQATVTLAQTLFEFNFVDGASHEISTTVKYNNIEVTEPYDLTFDKNMFSAAGTHKTTATLTADNFALSDNVVYVKVKGVKVGNNYYTIEDALDVAKEGQTIFVLNDTAFATQEIAGKLYKDKKFRTVETGVTLLLPFNENDTVGHIGAGKEGSDNYKATAALTGTAKLYKTLVIPEGIEVIVNGKLIVGAQTGTTAAGGVQNGVRGNYCEISLGGTITLNNATLEVYGYIKGNGEITANNTTVIENLCITGWLGGRESAGRYIGDGKSLIGSTNVDNPVQFPFSHYELRSVQLSITLHKGSKLQGYAKIATSAISVLPAQINEAWLTFASSDNNESAGLVRMKSSDAKIVKTFKDGRVGIETFGSVEDGYTSISLKVATMTISMASEKVFFPICGKTDIVIKSGTFTQKYKYKLMPGSSLTIENGATLNQNGSIVVYTGDFKDVSDTHYPSGLGDAKFTVDGTLNINGAFGGKVLSTTAGNVVVGANATITDVYSPEGKGNVSNAMITSYAQLDKTMTTKSLVFVNANNSTVAAETNKTYNYNNGTWQ